MVSKEPTPTYLALKRVALHLLLILGGTILIEALLARFIAARPSMQNVEWWRSLAGLMDRYGFFNVWTPYPPVFPTLFHAMNQIVPEGYLQTAWVVFNVCLLLGQACLIFAITRHLLGNSEKSLPVSGLAAFTYLAAMWRPRSIVLMGPWMDQFDYLPTFLLLLGLLLLLKRRETGSAVACGIGIMTKVFPGLLILLALPILGWKRGLRYAAAAAAICVVIALPFALSNGKIFLSTYRWSASRPPWESVWAYAFPALYSREPLANVPATPSPERSERFFTAPYGRDNAGPSLDGATESRMKPVDTITFSLTLFCLAAAALMLARGGAPSPVKLCRTSLVMVLALLLFSKGFSSYFIVWAAPLLCILYPGAQGFGLCALLILLGNAELLGLMARWAEINGDTHTFARLTAFGSSTAIFWGSIFAREICLLLIAGHQLLMLRSNREITI